MNAEWGRGWVNKGRGRGGAERGVSHAEAVVEFPVPGGGEGVMVACVCTQWLSQVRCARVFVRVVWYVVCVCACVRACACSSLRSRSKAGFGRVVCTSVHVRVRVCLHCVYVCVGVCARTLVRAARHRVSENEAPAGEACVLCSRCTAEAAVG